MKQLLTILIFASPVLAEPVCEKWMRECHREAFAERHCAGWTDVCTKWHETPTPIATPENPFGKCMQWRYGSTGLSECDAWSPAAAVDPRIRNDLGPPVAVDVAGRIIVSKKSDAEALKALGLKMCEGR